MMGTFKRGKEWRPEGCHAYQTVRTPKEQIEEYADMVGRIMRHVANVSAAIVTQITDVELECDGFLNYGRTSKFSRAETETIRAANIRLVRAMPGRETNQRLEDLG